MIKFDVTNRWTGAVQFTAEIDCVEAAPVSVKLGLAVRWGAKAGAYLAGAYLARADLAGAYLTGADLTGANLTGADLTGANLARADLTGADLTGADLTGAYLTGANLTGADLTGADLTGANLARADLTGADLTGAYLTGADLTGANLTGAKWRDGITITKQPIQIYGLAWPVTILDAHMKIGCELHSLADWAAFGDRRILQMAGKDSAEFWRAHKEVLLALARNTCRSFKQPAASQAEAA